LGDEKIASRKRAKIKNPVMAAETIIFTLIMRDDTLACREILVNNS
jgi:hypothetical protein